MGGPSARFMKGVGDGGDSRLYRIGYGIVHLIDDGLRLVDHFVRRLVGLVADAGFDVGLLPQGLDRVRQVFGGCPL